MAAKRDALNNWVNSASQAILKTVAEKAGVTMDQTFVVALKTRAATITEHVEKDMPQSLAIQVSEDLSVWNRFCNVFLGFLMLASFGLLLRNFDAFCFSSLLWTRSRMPM